MSAFDSLSELFRQFPGIGPRQAKRFVYFLLSQEPTFVAKLAELASALKDEIRQCKECFRYFQRRNGAALCPICADQNRTGSVLMVVAKDTDLESLEKSGVYDGRYFVLGGTIPLLEAKSADRIRTKELMARIGAGAQSGELKEVILALSANTEGEFTADELRKILSPLIEGKNIRISTLGRGLSTGSELEYADKETLKSALQNRSV